MNVRKHALILFVEDDTDDQEFLIDAIAQTQLETTFQIAVNGKQALAILASLPEDGYPCLIVLDLNMPVMDGYQMLEELNKHKRYQKIPKVVFTTSNEVADKSRCLEIGALDYFVKPSDIHQWKNTAQRIVNYCN